MAGGHPQRELELSGSDVLRTHELGVYLWLTN